MDAKTTGLHFVGEKDTYNMHTILKLSPQIAYQLHTYLRTPPLLRDLNQHLQ